MIQINNLVKKFDDFTALDGVNMNVEKGAVYGLVGPNGAGKSTLIRHITGVMRQDAGEVFIDGEPVYENARIKGHMAYIPDDMFYFLQSDTINMMHYYKGMYPNFDEKQFYRMQEFFPSIDVKRNIRKGQRFPVFTMVGKADPGNLQFGFHRKAPKRNVLALIYVTVLVLVQVFHFVYVRNSM